MRIKIIEDVEHCQCIFCDEWEVSGCVDDDGVCDMCNEDVDQEPLDWTGGVR